MTSRLAANLFTVSTFDANGATAGTPNRRECRSRGRPNNDRHLYRDWIQQPRNQTMCRAIPFKVGDFGTVVTNPGEPVDFAVPLTVTDGDGDTAAGAIKRVPDAQRQSGLLGKSRPGWCSRPRRPRWPGDHWVLILTTHSMATAVRTFSPAALAMTL